MGIFPKEDGWVCVSAAAAAATACSSARMLYDWENGYQKNEVLDRIDYVDYLTINLLNVCIRNNDIVKLKKIVQYVQFHRALCAISLRAVSW